jgi:Xaa-Pro aminopeptidase
VTASEVPPRALGRPRSWHGINEVPPRALGRPRSWHGIRQKEETLSAARKKVAALRELMIKAGLEAYYVPSTDPHQSEYVPACWQRRAWLSGFSGSAGDLVVTRAAAGLWTDGRYFIQAAEELRGSGIKLFKQGMPGVASPSAWLARTLRPGQVLGVDPQLLSRGMEAELRVALDPVGARLKLVEGNLVDRIWTDRPSPSKAPLELLPEELCGERASSKLRRLRRAMEERGVTAHVLAALDAIAWLFNVRSQDVEYNPVAIAYAIVTPDQALLFVDLDKVSGEVRRGLPRGVQLHPYEAAGAALAQLARERRRVWVDGRSVNCWVLSKLGDCPLVTEASAIHIMKARKNAAEIDGMTAAHRRDGRAMVRFLAWLERAVPAGGVTELSSAERLAALRAEGEHYRGESFETIAAYGAHGAIIHYGPTVETSAPLAPEGIFLIDSGGQYLDGTTDITRTVLLGGQATAEQRDRFTRVLRGHIALARCCFPAGTSGRQIDALARLALWEAGLNYNHGTGHGVGSYLNVHEGPQAISPTRCTGVPLEEGNIQSDEPGYYKEGEYGIRLENLVRVVRDDERSSVDSPFLRFEVLTLCPIDQRLIEPALLSADERGWLDAYHACVREVLSEGLTVEEREWLEQATRPLA